MMGLGLVQAPLMVLRQEIQLTRRGRVAGRIAALRLVNRARIRHDQRRTVASRDMLWYEEGELGKLDLEAGYMRSSVSCPAPPTSYDSDAYEGAWKR